MGVVGICNRRGSLTQGLRFTRAKYERRAFSRQFFSDCATQSATSRSDECDFVFQSEIHNYF